MPILRSPLPTELVKGEHFVLANLLKLIPRSSLQEDSAPEHLIWPDYLSLAAQDPKPTPSDEGEKEEEGRAGKGY